MFAPALKEVLGQVVSSPRVEPPYATSQPQGQLMKSFQDVLEEMQAMNPRPGKPRQREGDQFQERAQELTDREKPRVSQTAEVKAKNAALRSELVGGSRHDEPTTRAPAAPFSAEIQLDPVPGHCTDKSSDPQTGSATLKRKVMSSLVMTSGR